jgi:hypothetical protein
MEETMWTLMRKRAIAAAIALALGTAMTAVTTSASEYCPGEPTIVVGDKVETIDPSEPMQAILFPVRIGLRGFSMAPPFGEYWCLAGRDASGSSVTISYSYMPFYAELSVEERAHSYRMFASLDDVEGGTPKTADELLAAARSWIGAGVPTGQQPSGNGILLNKPGPDSDRFTLIQGNATPDNRLGLECVRYDLSLEERNDPAYPDLVLDVLVLGYLCLNLQNPDELIDIGYTERFIKDRGPSRLLMKALKRDADAFLASIWQAPPRSDEEVERYRAAAERGFVQPQFSLGMSYNIKGDNAQALRWYLRAAEQGHAQAAAYAGGLYRTGLGVDQNYAEAAKWLQYAADKGVAEAQVLLGLMCKNGEGFPQSYGPALKWFRLAADQGFADGQFYLGLAYAYGQSVMPDAQTAYTLFTLAASRTEPGTFRDQIIAERDKVAATMTPEMIAEAEEAATNWTPGGH